MILSRTINNWKRCGPEYSLKLLFLSLLILNPYQYVFRPTIGRLLIKYETRKIEFIRKNVNDIEAIVTTIDVSCCPCRNKKRQIEIFLPPYDLGLSRDLLKYALREPLHVKHLIKTIKHRGLSKVLDMGANVGYFPLIELCAGAKEVVAIEPIPQTFKFLKLNLERSCSTCKAINAAVDVEDGEMELLVPIENGNYYLNLATSAKILGENRNIGNTSKSFERVMIKKINVIKAIEKYKPNLLRSDMEGWDYFIYSKIDDIESSVEFIDIENYGNVDNSIILKAFKNLERMGFRKAKLIFSPKFLPYWILKLSRSIPLDLLIFLKGLSEYEIVSEECKMITTLDLLPYRRKVVVEGRTLEMVKKLLDSPIQLRRGGDIYFILERNF